MSVYHAATAKGNAMDLLTLRIEGSDKTKHDAPVCNVIMTYELVEFDAVDVRRGAESYAVLHRVQLEPTADSTFTIDCPLDDDEVLVHFENMLSSAVCNLPVMQGEGA